MATKTTHHRLPAKKLSISERRLRKEERRKTQRAANTGRALKMRVARQTPTLSLKYDGEVPALNVGCSGWFYWHWRGTFYPQTMPTNRWFAHYGRNFRTVELNAPFYSWPTVNTVKAWLRQAPKHFIYTIKVCELITHLKRFRGTGTLIKDFGYIADLLGPHMGCFLFQLPPSFHYTPARLKIILGQLDPARRNVVEFRHRSWWQPKVYAAFRQTGVIFCSCSAPNLPDELIATSGNVYIRFHGPTKWYRHNYAPTELAVWVERIRASGCRCVWAYFNNDHEAHAVKNAKELAKQLKMAFSDYDSDHPRTSYLEPPN